MNNFFPKEPLFERIRWRVWHTLSRANHIIGELLPEPEERAYQRAHIESLESDCTVLQREIQRLKRMCNEDDIHGWRYTTKEEREDVINGLVNDESHFRNVGSERLADAHDNAALALVGILAAEDDHGDNDE